uniref:WRKY19-like zinc finger domain-containing protein n=1 Tax=Hyaloperonospora arabidopsidis (strain Emoy2) TaxID=559515 RepID=M4B3M8_HYAAE
MVTHGNMTNDSKRASPKFSELLHAASHSPGNKNVLDVWPSEYPSTSETDNDDDDEEEEGDDVQGQDDGAVEAFHPETTAGCSCRSPGCLTSARSRGQCPTHGTGVRCRVQGCMKHVVSGGVCVGHGRGRRCRASPRCTSSAVSHGLCVQHGGGRKCNEEGCNKHVASGGLCRTHGGGRRCQVSDCTSSAQSRGLCYVHGGGGRCQREGCGSSAKKGGLCIAHGGGHRCQVVGCASSAVSGARCRAHGGGRRCAVKSCTSSAKTGGRCIAHGGGKRCTVDGCTSSAQRLGLCKAHGGGRRCVAENCANSAVSRGRCIAHGGGKRCVFEGCTTTARKGGFCFAHGGRSTPSTASIKSKLVAHPSPLPSTPATVIGKPPSYSTAEVCSPIPALSLPPRRLLPPINTMLIANRPGSQRHYQYTQIPPIRVPVVSLERGGERRSNGAQNAFDEGWSGTLNRGIAKLPIYLDFQDQAPQRPPTPVLSSTRAGYSWQRLQETIRRESRVHGITKDDDEAAYEDKSTCKAGDHERQMDGVLETGSRFYWTRSRGSIV